MIGDKRGFPSVKYSGASHPNEQDALDDLYYQRAVLFSILCRLHFSRSGKSKYLHDGTMRKGMFIAWINTPIGHSIYPFSIDSHWELFKAIPEHEKAPTYEKWVSDHALLRLQTLPVIDVSHASYGK